MDSHSTKFYSLYLSDTSQSGIYCASPIDLAKSPDVISEQGYELWRYVPKYEAHLDPGDVLFNPAWWWHWVDNTSETSIGVANRFPSDTFFAGNAALQMLAMGNPHAIKVFPAFVDGTRQALHERGRQTCRRSCKIQTISTTPE